MIATKIFISSFALIIPCIIWYETSEGVSKQIAKFIGNILIWTLIASFFGAIWFDL